MTDALDMGRTQRHEDGFSLIEVLVVVLIIAVLAGIAIPALAGQGKKGQDGSAKASVRQLQSEVESCFTDSVDYRNCDTAPELGVTGLDIGPGPGQVQVAASTVDAYTIAAVAKSGNTFTLVRAANGQVQRSCTGSEGCKAGAW